nr:PREDICTED: transcriptional regulator Kaiso [Lepisosteus oculatus]
MTSLKLISATDTQYSGTLLKSLNEQRTVGLFCDVTIIVQDRKFRAHKNILSASSSYFRQLFSVAGQVIELNFVKAEIFEEILNYIYSSKLIRVRSDMLEELIKSGETLGVNFIANLGLPLSQVKGLPGLSKDAAAGGEESSSDPKDLENGTGNPPSDLIIQDSCTAAMPIITEAFSLSAEEFKQTDGYVDEDSDNDDVIFCSELVPPRTGASGSTAQSAGPPTEIIDLEGPSEKEGDASGGEDSKEVSTHGPPPKDNQEGTGVQKKQVTTVLEASPAKPGEFKIKLSDVRSAIGAKNGAGQSSPQNLVAGKKTITLDKASEIDSLSTGCKVYANIGENTYDIVIPMKDDPGEGDSKASGGRKARMSSPYSQDSPSRKKVKVRHDDHYELIMDGRTFYVCIVCKRSYVCLTSLRRHFNTHSWEKKYPCRYCDKVFALAEYRTKHEIYHTGERRYQCLLCNEFFINYQLLSSHCKSAHNQDPSGRKEKDDTDNNLYRLLPCKSLQLKPYSYVPNSSGGIPIINEEGLVYHVDPSKTPQSSPGTQPPSTGKQVVNWDDIFVQPGAQPETYINPTEGTSEFEFVIPETY